VNAKARYALFLLVGLLLLLPFSQIITAQENDCPLGQGYWKNHVSGWPLTELVLGDETYTQAELLVLLNTPPIGDASLILARQLVAAKLNVEFGADASAVSAAITQADTIFAEFEGKLPYNVAPSSEDGQVMVAAANIFDAYNQGLLDADCAQAEVTPEVTDEAGDDLDIVIIVEGPVQSINLNIITIYGIDIALDPNDPLLSVIRIGDIIHVEGSLAESAAHTIIIVAVTVVVISVDVVVDEDSGVVWRDDGSCNNGPPPWAAAHGWRRRCEGGNASGNDKDKNKDKGKGK
jgi:hypothetical protein